MDIPRRNKAERKKDKSNYTEVMIFETDDVSQIVMDYLW